MLCTLDAAKVDSNTPENPVSVWEQQGQADQQGSRRWELRSTAKGAERDVTLTEKAVPLYLSKVINADPAPAARFSQHCQINP